MNSPRKFMAAAAVLIGAAGFLVLPQFAGSSWQPMPGMSHASPTAADGVPAFHAKPPEDALPPTMEPSVFTDVLTFNAYAVAGRTKKVIYQQPCYCRCDRSQGHGSLLDCFVSRHGSGCDVCQKEVFYSYEQAHKGKNPTQIREGIIHGDWATQDLTKYAQNYLARAKTAAK